MAKYEGFMPEFLTSTTNRSYRSFYKWGDETKFYKPSNRSNIYAYMRDALELDDEFFKTPNYADTEVSIAKDTMALLNRDIDAIRGIVGDANVSINIDDRIEASITKSHEEVRAMHNRVLPRLVDAVVFPSLSSEIAEILEYARGHNITCVTKSTLIPKYLGNKTIAIDLTRHYNKIVEFNEVDQYVKVEAGMHLLILENIMRNAPDNFKDYNVTNRYTIGHFPLEAEECTLYDADNGIRYGLEAGYFGTFDEIVKSREYIMPDGKVVNEYEDGAVLSTLTLSLTRYYEHNNYGFSYMFPSFQEGVNAMREIFSRAGAVPQNIKLSDPNETSMLMRYYLLDDSIIDGYLKGRKVVDGERCLMVGYTGGPYTASRLAYNTTKRIVKKYKGISLTSILADAYVESRYTEMYAREAMADFDIDTESEYHACQWSELPIVHASSMEHGAHEYVRSRVICPSENGAVLEIVRNSVKK